MTNDFKKIYAGITAMSLAITAQVYADQCNSCDAPTQCHKPAPCCQPTPCCTPACHPSPYCGPNCLPAPFCGEVNFKGELLYWTPELGGLESAFGTTTIATTVSPDAITTTTTTEVDHDPDSKWDFGFRVGADVAYTCFDLETDWTHFDGHANFHHEDQHGNWKVHYDVIDLTIGRRCCASPCVYFKPYIGLRGARIRQSLDTHLETLFTALIGNNIVNSDRHDHEKYLGIGPQLGLEANWYLGCNFSLYGNVDAVTYYGEVKSKNYDTDTFTSTISVSDGRKHYRFLNIGTDGAIGFRYDKSWNVSCYAVNLMLKLGVEQHRIYELSNLGSDGTLSLDGGVFAVGIGFRY